MLKVGLTGGIGSGKSTVTDLLKKEGFDVIDADVVSREVLELYPQVLEEISKEFGQEFIDEEGKLRRKALGSFIFKNEVLVNKLENIILPYILKEVFARLNKLEKKGERICFVDAPTLIEVGLHKAMDYNVLVWVDRDTQLKRVMKRDGISKEEAIIRINAQLPLDEKKKEVNYIIDNSMAIERTKVQVKALIEELARV